MATLTELLVNGKTRLLNALYCEEITSSGNILIQHDSTPNVVIKNTNNEDVYLELNRNSNTDWRILNSGGIFYIQTDGNSTGKTSYFDVLKLYEASGNMEIKGTITGNYSTSTSSISAQNNMIPTGGNVYDKWKSWMLETSSANDGIFNALTNNGALQGAFTSVTENGVERLYLNAYYINGYNIDGTLIKSHALCSKNYTATDGSTFSTTGTWIDLNEGTIQTPYFNSNATGASFNGNITNGNVKLTPTDFSLGTALTYTQATDVLKISASSISLSGTNVATTSDVSTAVDGIAVGGRNLILNSLKNISGSDYSMAGVSKLSEDLIQGETYTLTVNGRSEASSGHYLKVCIYKKDREWANSINITESADTTKSITFIPTYSGAAYIEAFYYPNNGDRTGGVTVNWLKLEKGNKATDWTPAPEDVDASIQVNADKIALVVQGTDSTGKVELTADAVSVINQNINLTGKVTFSSFDSSTQSQIDGIADTATGAQNAVNNMEIGGRNLLKNSGVAVTNSSYGIKLYNTTETLLSGETYTVSMCVTPAANVNQIAIYSGNGVDRWALMSVSGTGKQVISSKLSVSYTAGKSPSENVVYGYPYISRFPNNGTVTGATTIHWIKIEKGNKATDWTPAPEDQDAYADTAVKVVTDNIYTTGTTEINGGKIRTGSVKADKIDVIDLFSKTITATGTITGLNLIGGSLNIGSGNLAIDTGGNLTSKGSFSVGDGLLTYDSVNGIALKGKITATKGTIGGMSLSENSLTRTYRYATSYSGGATWRWGYLGFGGEQDLYGDEKVIYVANNSYSGQESDWNAPKDYEFYVTYGGSVYAENISAKQINVLNGVYFGNGTDYYINSSGSANFDALGTAGIVNVGRNLFVGANTYFAGGSNYFVNSAGIAKFAALSSTGTLLVSGESTYTGKTTHNGGIASTSGTFSSTLAVTGDTTLSSTLKVSGTTTFAGNVYFANGTTYYISSAGKGVLNNMRLTNGGDYYITVPDGTAVAALSSRTSTNYIYVGNKSYVTMLQGSTVYLNSTSTTVTSDRNEKNNIESLDERYEDFFKKLRPTRFKYNDGTSGRYHSGFIAQEVYESLVDSGLTSYDFAGYVDIEKSGHLGLMYDDFIAINTHMIQNTICRTDSIELSIEELRKEISNLKKENQSLLNKISAIE